MHIKYCTHKPNDTSRFQNLSSVKFFSSKECLHIFHGKLPQKNLSIFWVTHSVSSGQRPSLAGPHCNCS